MLKFESKENARDLPAQFDQGATLAQLVERLIRNQQVAGSIPAGGSSFLSYLAGPISH